MNRLDREQKRRQQATRANLKAIAWILLILFVGVLLGSFVQIAAAETGKPDTPMKAVVVQYIAPPAEEPPIEEPLEPERVYLGEFTVTHYCCEKRPHICGTGDGITASGTEVTPYRSCAVDPDVIPLGSEVILYMEDGSIVTYIAEDVGGAVKGSHIDLAVPTHQEALEAGVKTASVYVLEDAE